MEPNNKVFLTVKENLKFLENHFGSGINLVVRRYELSGYSIPLGLVYIDTIADKEIVMDHVVRPVLQCGSLSSDINLQFLKSHVIFATETQQTSDMNYIISRIMNGDTAIFLEQNAAALIIGTRKVEKRSVEAPENESTVLGSQESFTDDLKINCSLILKRLSVPNLKFEEYTVGAISQTKVKLIWLDGIANEAVINEAKNRIGRINIDNVDGIGTLAELIEDKPLSLFPKYRQTERPDVAAKYITNGCFIIICSNSPFAFIAPISFWDNFKTMDDYEERSVISSYLRLVRYISFVLSIMVSSLYLSFVAYNHAIVPANLAVNIARSREGVPFPSVLELLLLTFSITIIREAGLRMPGSVGYFVGTLAAVVIGTAIVNAGYVSSSLIIVVAVSTISLFAISSTTIVYPAMMINYIFIFLAAGFGVFGLVCGLIFLFWYLITIESFGMPYLYPVVPYEKGGLKDIFVRFPIDVMKKRLKLLAPQNRTRSGNNGAK